MLTAITILFLLTIAWWSTHREKKQYKSTFNQEADMALHTVRKIAKRRAAQASIPIPVSMQFDSTPIHGTKLPVQPPPPRAVTSQPYAVHTRRRGDRKDRR